MSALNSFLASADSQANEDKKLVSKKSESRPEEGRGDQGQNAPDTAASTVIQSSDKMPNADDNNIASESNPKNNTIPASNTNVPVSITVSEITAKDTIRQNTFVKAAKIKKPMAKSTKNAETAKKPSLQTTNINVAEQVKTDHLKDKAVKIDKPAKASKQDKPQSKPVTTTLPAITHDKYAYRHYITLHPCACKLLEMTWDEKDRQKHLEKIRSMKAAVDNKVFSHKLILEPKTLYAFGE